MPEYKCEKCNRVFGQRSHYNDHLKKKIDCRQQTTQMVQNQRGLNNIESHNLEDEESLYDLAFPEDEVEVSFEAFKAALDDLIDVGYVRRNHNDDDVLYSSSDNLTWDAIKHIDCPIKKQIILQFIESPNSSFILQNTQRGKAGLVAIELCEWARDSHTSTCRPVSFIMLSNDQSLGDQTLNAFLNHKWVDDEGNYFVLSEKIKSFHLSSSATTRADVHEIMTYIDAYAAIDDYGMPLITYLSNDKQNKKILQILHHIRTRAATRYPTLRYAIISDEADENYRRLRDKQENIQGTIMSLQDFTNEDPTYLYKLCFVTATEGTLLDDYPECANAQSYKTDMDENDTKFYRAMHHDDSIQKIIRCPKNRNNSTLLELLKSDEYKEYFENPVRLRNGSLYYRKVIFNSNHTAKSMAAFAKEVTQENKYYAITFNQAGLTLYKSGKKFDNYRTKGKVFNKILFLIYKKLSLGDKPLIILGRKKVDRGLGFHYAPRPYMSGPKPEVIKYEEKLGELLTDGIEGLIWTDVFLGRIENRASAVQKAGRGAGIIAQCDQYIGSVTYWTDQATANAIITHNKRVDHVNKQYGCNTMLQSMTKAKEAVSSERDTRDQSLSDPKSVPTVLQITQADFESINNSKKGRKWNREYILEIIKKHSNEEYDKIKNMELNQIVCPGPDSSSYNKLITAFINAKEANTKYTWASGEKKNSDTYQIYLDKCNYKIIISIYYGSKNISTQAQNLLEPAATT